MMKVAGVLAAMDPQTVQALSEFVRTAHAGELEVLSLVDCRTHGIGVLVVRTVPHHEDTPDEGQCAALLLAHAATGILKAVTGHESRHDTDTPAS